VARVTHVKRAQQRYETKPVIDPETGQQKIIALTKKDGSPKTTKKGRPVVVRATEADKTRPLPMPKCEKCGKVIEVGTPYKWVKPKSGPYGGRQRNRCAGCPSWKPSELTGSAALSTLYGAQEAAEDALAAWDPEDGVDALAEILTTLAEGVREAAEVYEESANNMEDGFGHETYQSAELREKAEELNGQADTVESAADDLEEFDEDAAKTEVEDEVDRDDYVSEGLTEEEIDALHEAAIEEALDEKRTEWGNEQTSTVEDALAEVSAP
jgi:hypothetical protein